MAPTIVILHDLAAADGGASNAAAVRLGLQEVEASGVRTSGLPLTDVEVVSVTAEGHPRGSPDTTASALRGLGADSDVVAVIGPAISDNALVCTPVADEIEMPCINWSGSQLTRSKWMFHYQVGSLEDEPYVLARNLAERGLRRVGLVREDSIIGRQYASFLDDAVAIYGLELLGTVDLSVTGDDGDAAVAGLDALAPDAVVYLGLGVSARGLSLAMVGRPWPVVTNSALMFAHGNPDWRKEIEGWVYVDAYDEANPVRAELYRNLGIEGQSGFGPIPTYDMGRLVGFALAHAAEPTRAGVRDGLERVKQVPAALGSPGTIMGFGNWKHNALEGGYLVLRQWRDGESVPARA
jgi:ABC-type branched-subunit amino acid transport system substrate-binding protein